MLLSTYVLAQVRPGMTTADTPRLLKGRVIAYVDHLVLGAGIGPKYETFIFGVESQDDKGTTVLEPVKIDYAFFKSDGQLPRSFFDHKVLYELRVLRDSRCDESVNNLSYEQNVDINGKPLPPTYIVRFVTGVDAKVLKSDAVLPCYILRPGDYAAKD
jgi:hypothetical protein